MTENERFDAELAWARDLAKTFAMHLPMAFDLEDLQQEAAIGLLEACRKWDETRNVPFRAYAWMLIRGRCYMSVRRRSYKFATAVELDFERPDTSESVELQVMAGQRAAVEESTDRACWEMIGSALAEIQPADADLLRCFIAGVPESDLASLTGSTEKQVHRRVHGGNTHGEKEDFSMSRPEDLSPEQRRDLVVGFENHETFCAECLRLPDRTGSRVPLAFWPSQRKLEASIQRQIRRGQPVRQLVLKTRRSGFTVGSCSQIFRRVPFFPGRRAAIIADQYRPRGSRSLRLHRAVPGALRAFRAPRRFDPDSLDDSRRRPYGAQVGQRVADRSVLGRHRRYSRRWPALASGR